jgi:hypothetical protein
LLLRKRKKKDSCWGATQKDPYTKMVKSSRVMKEDKHKNGQEFRSNAKG